MNQAIPILLVEDDEAMAFGLEFNLRSEGYAPTHCADGESALANLKSQSFGLVVLDMMLPDMSGLDILRHLRQRDLRTPVLILSATAVADAIIEGLNAGADDYLTKPFDLDILLARIRSLLRSRQWLTGDESGSRLQVGAYCVDFKASTLTSQKGTIDLSYKEAMLLRRLTDKPNQIVTREELLRDVWGYSDGVQTRTIDTFILALRKKLEPDPKKPRYVLTVPGEGYRFVPD